ncbi:MAG: DNA polymerase I [bacterium]
MNKKRLFLIDATALAYRSFFAFISNPLINSKGINTSGIFGFTNTLIKILREEKPYAAACVFDTSAPTFRHKIYTDYKATREKMPDELAEQFPIIKKMVHAFNLPLIEKDGYEADDVIGTLAKKAVKENLDVLIVGGDKDFMQLIEENIKMFVMGRGRSGEVEIIDQQGVVKKVGVTAEKIIDYMALMGDKSDNIPGIPGIGKKTAKKLIVSHGSLENILEKAETLKGEKLKENILDHKQQALLSRKLVTIDTQVPLDIEPDSLQVKDINKKELISLFKELEFTSLIGRIKEVIVNESGDTALEKNYSAVTSREQLQDLISQLQNADCFALDLETTSLEPISTDIVGLSFSLSQGKSYYVPILFPDEDKDGFWFTMTEEQRKTLVLSSLKPVLENPDIKKYGQNIKFDWLVLKYNNINIQGVAFDTMVAAYLINPSSRRYNLDILSMEYLHLHKISTEELIGSGKKQIGMHKVPLNTIAEYACEDADAVFQLKEILDPKLTDYNMQKLFHTVEMPFVKVLMELEENGVAIDKELLKKLSREMKSELNTIQQEIFDIAGEEFNINSTQQLGIILFEKMKIHELLGIKRVKRTKTGYSTNEQVLQSLSVHPLARKLLDYRKFKKLKSTYVDALPKLINSQTGRIHASFNQTVTVTGRISTSKPNLQNIPIKTELGREIRKAFIAGNKDWKIISADYSQIELRIMAHLSGDTTLIESFRNGEDIHLRTASEIFDVPPDEITDDLRSQAKTINFGIIYGMGAYGLASRLGISNQEAENFIHAYFAKYPMVNTYIANTIAKAYEKGFVTTLLNRRRYLPELKNSNQRIREFGERTAVNTPIQGTAADLIKIAMIRISDNLQDKKWKSKLILQIHDELLFESPADEIESLKEMITKEMTSAIQLTVPIEVDIGAGDNWLEAH